MGHDKLFQKRSAELHRLEGTRLLRKILIFCEGTKTEPNYFRAFPENPKVYDALSIEGKGYNTVSLVEEAIRLKKEAWKSHTPYQEIWCVFDRDAFSWESFTSAIERAKSENIRCAYSIEAFEIWYLLHFNYYDTGLSRSQYKEKLTAVLQMEYKKNDEAMYERLEDKQEAAIRNAKRLREVQSSQTIRQQNPVTTVYELVEKLRG